MGKKHRRNDDEHETRPAKESKTSHRKSNSGDDGSSTPSESEGHTATDRKHKKQLREKRSKKEKKDKKYKKSKESIRHKKSKKRKEIVKEKEKALVEEAKRFLANAQLQQNQRLVAGSGAVPSSGTLAVATEGWSGWHDRSASKPWEGAAADLNQTTEDKAMLRLLERKKQQQFRQTQEADMEELEPKATGREALQEKRAARRQEALEREASPEMASMYGGGDLMGGEDSFAAAKARLRMAQERRAQKNNLKREQIEDKAAVARSREEDRMAPFRALLASGGKLTIPKRNPNA